MSVQLDSVHCIDALELLHSLEPQSVDAIITDLPYGTTACSWDTVIPFAPLWAVVKHALKPRGVFVTTASQPFTSALVMSNPKWFKYTWVWVKSRPFDMFNAKNKPMSCHEDIAVFSEGTMANRSEKRMPYYPQGLSKVDKKWKRPRFYGSEHDLDHPSHTLERIVEFEGYPNTVLHFQNKNDKSNHPTQKPIDLYEYLILTYTQPNAIVVDPCCGSGTTGVAARNTGRRYILGDENGEYVEIARSRLTKPFAMPMFT